MAPRDYTNWHSRLESAKRVDRSPSPRCSRRCVSHTPGGCVLTRPCQVRRSHTHRTCVLTRPASGCVVRTPHRTVRPDTAALTSAVIAIAIYPSTWVAALLWTRTGTVRDREG